MTKFHINKHGVPGPCKAKAGNCPLGGEEQHFNSQEDAQDYADKVNSSKHGFLPTTPVKASLKEEVEDAKLEVSAAYKKSFEAGSRIYKAKNEEDKENAKQDKDIASKELGLAMADLENKQKQFLDSTPHSIDKKLEMTISENSFNTVFQDSWNEHGYEVTGVLVSEIIDTNLQGTAEEPAYEEVRSKIPEVLKNRALGGKSDYLIKEGNIDSHVRNHIMTDYPEGYEMEDRRNEIVTEMLKHSPEDVVFDELEYKGFRPGALRDDVGKYIGESLRSDSKLKINGQNVYIEDDDSLKNKWGKEYFEGGRYEAFKKEEAEREKNNPNIKIERALDAMKSIQEGNGESRNLIDRMNGNVDKRLSSLSDEEIDIVQSMLDKK